MQYHFCVVLNSFKYLAAFDLELQKSSGMQISSHQTEILPRKMVLNPGPEIKSSARYRLGVALF